MSDIVVVPFGKYDRCLRLFFDVVIGGLVFYGFR